MTAILKTYPAFKRSENKSKILDEFLNPEGNFHEVDYLGYMMPGFIEKVHEWCGEWKTKGCLNIEEHKNRKAFIKRYQRSCYRADCKTCSKKWLARLANRSCARFTIFQANEGYRAKHLVVSPPSWYHQKSVKYLKKFVYKLLKNVGCFGGTVIFHAYRNYKNDAGQKIWYYSPHFHVVGFGWIAGTAKTYQKNGWVVKNVGIRKSIFSTLYYQLSHSTIVKGRHTITWFGRLSYHNSQLKVEDEPLLQLCPMCKHQLEDLEWNGRGEPPPDEIFEGCVDVDWYFAPKIPYIPKK